MEGLVRRSLAAAALALGILWFPSGARALRAGGAEGPRFTDATDAAGIRFRHTNGRTGRCRYLEIMGAGVAVFDFDGDGRLDIYFVNGNRILEPPSPEIRNALYRNEGDGTFADVTERAGAGDPSYGQGCCVGDYDDDGDQDLYVTNFGPDRLFRNEGGRFADATAAAGIDNPLWGQSCEFFDFDGDGWLDLYVQNYLAYSTDADIAARVKVGGKTLIDYASPRAFRGTPDKLYRNRGDGTFEDVSLASGIGRFEGRGMGLACADFDEDGDPDVFVSNDAMTNCFFRNDGGGKFTELAVAIGLGYDADGNAKSFMGVAAGDVDGDGRIDIVCPATRNEFCMLYSNRGSHFVDASRAAGISAATAGRTGFSPNLLDADGDGDLDLFIANGGVTVEASAGADADYERRYGVPDLLLLNDGKGRFRSAGAEAGAHFARALIGRGSATGDLDGDGDIDIVLNNLDGPAVLLRNDSPPGNWVTLQLVPARGNRDAIGAVVHVTAGGRTQTAVVRSAGGYLSASDRRPHFGLGGARSIERIEIRWPAGTRQTLGPSPANRILTIREP